MLAKHKNRKQLAKLRRLERQYRNQLKIKTISWELRQITTDALHNVLLDIDNLLGILPKWFRD